MIVELVDVSLHDLLTFSISLLRPIADGGDFILCVAGQFGPHVVDLEDAAVLRVDHHWEGGVEHSVTEALLTGLELRRGLAPLDNLLDVFRDRFQQLLLLS